ncbi:MAG: MFS transporter, partial [Gammaproteobacteria bacterium]|nr:MFS transporter [Gammaproteobacteria bacterium]
HRAKAVAVSQIGYSLGGLLVPIVIVSLEMFGWRTTAFASGVIVMIVGLPLVQLVRHRPEPYGEHPDGVSADDHDHHVQTRSAASRDFTAREAMRTPAFWLISLGHAMALLTVSAVMVHLIPHLTEDLDFTLSAAGGIVALMTAFQLAGQILGGYLGDRFNKRFICIGCMIAHAAGMLMLAFAASVPMVIGFAVLHGLGWGTRGPMMVALRADYFGSTAFGTIMGFSSLIVMFGMAAGPIVAGYMADVSGNYESGFAVLALGSLFGSIFFLTATPPSMPVRATTS